MAEKYVAYHGDAELKEKFVALVRWHREQDKFIQGWYWKDAWEGLTIIPEKGRGCAVGCSIESLRKITGRGDIKHNDHDAYAKLLGVPFSIAYLEDYIFEELSEQDAKLWPERFAEAIPVGANLSAVGATFSEWRKDTDAWGDFPRQAEKLLELIRATAVTA